METFKKIFIDSQNKVLLYPMKKAIKKTAKCEYRYFCNKKSLTHFIASNKFIHNGAADAIRTRECRSHNPECLASSPQPPFAAK